MIGSITLQEDGKYWIASVDDNVATYSWAKDVNGKWQTQQNVVKSGKNIGKANETTPHQQAVGEIQTKINKKIVEGYVVTQSSGCLMNLDLKEATKSPLPMLAHKFHEHYSKVLGKKCFIQQKLDGIRCVANASTGELFSRKGEQINWMPHITKAIVDMNLPSHIEWLDGELYNHDMEFQKITSIVRTLNNIHPEHELVQYHVYDYIDSDVNKIFEDRKGILHASIPSDNDYIKKVVSIEYNKLSMDNVNSELESHLALNYEGIMIRGSGGKYKADKRSSELLKVKKFEDKEFPIVGLNSEEHKDTLGTFRLMLPDGRTFDSTPKMKDAQKQEIWDSRFVTDWTKYVANCRFQGYTDDGIPRINVTAGIRHVSDC